SKRAVKLKLQQRSNNLGGGIYRVQENSLPRSEVTDDSSIHQQLVAAQKSIFEAELIDQVIREARSMPSVTLVENEIFIRIYQNVDLTIQWDNIETTEESPSTSNTWTAAVEADNFNMTISPESSTCTVLKLAMELMVRRYHRRHLLKQQERMLHGTKGPIREINHAQILSHLIHLLKYHFFCDHIREIVNASTKALRNGGIPVQIHFISNMAKGKDFVEDVWKKIGNDKVPLFMGMIIITIDRRRSLRFTLESPASVTVHLTHTDIKTRDLTKFQDLLSREINLFLLKIVHEQLNYLTGLDNVLYGNSTWLLDPAMMAIYKDVPPVLTNSEVKWPKALWRRPVKILIVNEHPSPDNLTLKVEA
ncbi:3262_t:CDS:2, partial [Acaulospora morrowiae]